MKTNDTFTIHTLPVMKSELKCYKHIDAEIKRIKQLYDQKMKSLSDEVYKIDQTMLNVKSPGYEEPGEGHGPNKTEYLNSLIAKKDIALEEMVRSQGILIEVGEWKKRKRTVEKYLDMMSPEDKQFIYDLYISNMRFRSFMNKYDLYHDNEVTRRVEKILKGVLTPGNQLI